MSGGDVVKGCVIGLVGWWVYETFFATPAAATATATLPTVSTTSPTAVMPAPVVPPATPAPSSGGLDALYQALLGKAQAGDGVTSSGGVLSANGDVWNYFLSQANSSVNTSALDPTVILAGLINGNRATPVTSSQYWAAAGPIVGKQLGLSGVRLGLAGLGAAIVGGSNYRRRHA